MWSASLSRRPGITELSTIRTSQPAQGLGRLATRQTTTVSPSPRGLNTTRPPCSSTGKVLHPGFTSRYDTHCPACASTSSSCRRPSIKRRQPRPRSSPACTISTRLSPAPSRHTKCTKARDTCSGVPRTVRACSTCSVGRCGSERASCLTMSLVTMLSLTESGSRRSHAKARAMGSGLYRNFGSDDDTASTSASTTTAASLPTVRIVFSRCAVNPATNLGPYSACTAAGPARHTLEYCAAKVLVKFVFMMPGCTTLTLMPKGSMSARSESENASSAHLAQL
mmetsp:Transcript_41784/g.83752  ORF Transcript_41784/g.83752 Transcript_41784/m.83752 type:complete len:281 (+) Transcript_41784:145-987(+)